DYHRALRSGGFMSWHMYIWLRSCLKASPTTNDQRPTTKRVYRDFVLRLSSVVQPAAHFRQHQRREGRTEPSAALILRNRIRRRLLIIGILALALAACGGEGITQTSQTQRYTVQLTLDSPRFGQRTATIDIHDPSGQPITADQVVLSPVME